MKKESVEEFLARGGKINKLEAVNTCEGFVSSRFKQRDIDNNDHDMKARLRIDNQKKAGKELTKDQKMYLKFRKRFGL